MTNIKEKLAEYFEMEINTLARIVKITSNYSLNAFLDRGLGAASVVMLTLGTEYETELMEMYESYKAKIIEIGAENWSYSCMCEKGK